MAGVGYFKSAQYNQIIQIKYKSKYKKLKKLIKDYVFENAALCDEISQIQESVVIIKEERNFLLQKFIEHDNDPDIEKLRRHIQNQPPPNPDGTPSHIPGKRGPKKRLNPDGSIRKNNKTGGNKKITNLPVQQPLPPPLNTPSSTPSLTPTTTKTTTIQQNSQGQPILPIHFNNTLTLHELGEIPENNENFHTENWIYPVGFMSTRVYAHPRNPNVKCTFTCKILNNDGYPQFQIIPDADYDHVFFGKSANICHLTLLETIVSSSNVKNLPIRAQGELFFGLGQPIIKTILQSNPNIKKCINFKGFTSDGGYGDNDPTLSYEALQKLLTISSYHSVPEIKEEPPDELLEK